MSALTPYDALPRWIAWRNEERDGKLTKVPYSPTGAGKARANDPRTWGFRPSAEALAREIVNGHGGGLGIELGDLGNEWSLGGIDLDTCRSPDGALEPWAVEIIARIASYAEISPSKTGAKVFFKYQTAHLGKLRAIIPDLMWGRQFSRGKSRDHPPAIEIHLGNRYFALTGWRIDSVPDEIAEVNLEDLLWLLTEIGPAFAAPETGEASLFSQASTDTHAPIAGRDASRSGAAFQLARSMRLSGSSYEQFANAARSNANTAAWCREKGELSGGRELRRTWEHAEPASHGRPAEGVTLSDFHAYMPMHSYIYVPTRALWPAGSVNARIPPIPIVDKDGAPKIDAKGNQVMMAAASWLDRNQPVEQMTWAPGLPEIIRDRLLYEGGWIERAGTRGFNQYLAPAIIPSNSERAGKWLNHVQYVYPEDANRMLDWYAHRVQRPQEKINHAIVMGGYPGIGKDTILEPVKQAIGPWNFQEASPSQIMGRFNGFLKAVILRISEARDLGDIDRFRFYDHMKTLTASPPDTLRIDEKHAREYMILNCCGIIFTTNHKTDGIYLPAEDRRHDIMWSERTKEDDIFAGDYWSKMYSYFSSGGNEAVAAFLRQRNIREFNPKAPPPQTDAFWAIVNAGRPTEESELTDLLESMKWPRGFTLKALLDQAEGGLFEWLADRKNRRSIPHRLERCGYVPVRNPLATDGLWSVSDRRSVIYAKADQSSADRLATATNMTERANGR